MDPDQTAPIGAVYSVSTLFASTLNSSVMLCNYLQQTISANEIFRCIFFLGALRVNPFMPNGFPIFINWKSSFLLLGLPGGIFNFYSNCKINETRRVLRRLILYMSHIRTLGLYGLTIYLLGIFFMLLLSSANIFQN